MKKATDWIKRNKVEFLVLLLIFLLASFLRFYRITEYMTFLGDEGRDALAVKRMIVEHKFRLIGPVTSIGNMYLGPLYYYLILPSMVVSGLSPVGPTAMVAVLGVVTVGLIWWMGKEWIGRKGAMIAAFLYAISPVVIEYSRSSWNPNVMPFFALLTIYGIWRVWQRREFWWLPIIGVTLSFALQSHWLGLLLFPTIGLFWLLTLIRVVKEKVNIKRFLLHTSSFILIFVVLTIVPLVWFDLRHNFINLNAFKTFFAVRQETVNLKIYKAIPRLGELIAQVFTRLLGGKDEFWGKWIALVIPFIVGLRIISEYVRAGWRKFLESNRGLILILTWFLVGLVGLGNYKQHIYDHYFGFFFPVPFLLTGWVLGRLWDWHKIQRSCYFVPKLMAVGGLVFLTLLSFKESPLRYPPNNQLSRTQKVARFILEKAQEKPFNLALIAERNYDDAYAYFMEIWGKPPARIEPLRAKETITEQLFVICEQIPCQPVGHPKAEIAMFGWTKIGEKWELEGVEVYRLVHNYPEGKPR